MSNFDWLQWLGVLATLLTISGAGYGILRWVRGYFFEPKSFEKDVTDNFTYRDVKAGVIKLVEYARNINPDEIVGINRGGAIVGGLIGKHLGIVPRIIEVDPENERLWFSDIEELHGKTVLLVDDRLSDGDHMIAAYCYLKANVGDIRRVVFAWIKKRQRVGQGPDEQAYIADSEHRLLPWEPIGGATPIRFSRRLKSSSIPFPSSSKPNHQEK